VTGVEAGRYLPGRTWRKEPVATSLPMANGRLIDGWGLAADLLLGNPCPMVGATIVEMAMPGTTEGSTSVGRSKGVATICGSRCKTQGEFYPGSPPGG
jgi:hypothetical protein